MTRMRRIILGAVVILTLVIATRLGPQARAQPLRVGRVYLVAQFVQTGTGPLWTTTHTSVFFIRGVLRPAPMQPIADFVLTSTGQAGNGSGGLALASGPRNVLVAPLLRVAFLRSLLPHTPDNPVLGTLATYRVVWMGCPLHGCSRSPWQLDSGGE